MYNTVEFPGEIDFCPYCGSNDLEPDEKDSDSKTCNDCGHDFTVMTHE
jgi:rRNA maturation endonuclease Nob1